MKIISSSSQYLELCFPQYVLRVVGLCFMLAGLGIGAFLVFIQPSMSLQLPFPRLFLFIFPLLFLGIGLRVVLSAKSVLASFDKANNQFTITQPNKISCALSNIKRVILQSPPQTSLYRVALEMSDGTVMPLVTTYDVFLSSHLKVAGMINQFLGLPNALESFIQKEKISKKLGLSFFFLGAFVVLMVTILKVMHSA